MIKTYNRFPYTGRRPSGAAYPKSDGAEFALEAAKYPSLHTNLVQAIKFGQTNEDGLGQHVFKDWSGNGNHAIAHSSRYYGDFDGTDDDFSKASHADFQPGSNDFSVVAWILKNVASDGNTILSHYNVTGNQRSWIVYYNSSNQLVLATSPNGTTLNQPASTDSNITNLLNTWVNVVVVKSGTTVTMYENNVALTVSGSADATLHNSTANVVLGDVDSSGIEFDGGIQEVRFYNGLALSAAQVATGYRTDVWPSGSTLKGYWPLNEASGNAIDASGNSHDLTLNGVTRRQGGLTHSPAIIQGVGMGGAMDHDDVAAHGRTPDFAMVGGTNNELTVFTYIQGPVGSDYSIGHWDVNGQRSWSISYDLGVPTFWISDDGSVTATHYKQYLTSLIPAIASGQNVSLMLRVSSGITLEIGVNGVVDSSPTLVNDDAITALHNSTAPLSVGCILNASLVANPIGGATSEVYIYNAVKTDADFLLFHEKHVNKK